MFAPRYFAPRYYAPKFWPPGLGLVVVEKEFGGRQFVGFIPLAEMLRQQIPVNAEIIQYTQETETEFIIDGKRYELVQERSPSQIIRDYPEMDKILDEAAKKMGTSRRKAKKELYNLIIEELKASQELKESIFDDDEDILMILVASDEI